MAGARRGFSDPRGTLFFEIARLVEARHPAYLILENVPYALLHIRYIMSCKQLCKVSFRK
ncbi:DNA cytosine methyltransferase [Gemmiger formicilis]|uniref:DNA cytosine methyltransferase n=1 Tax=Gemmiger formicilis TaxID=745368 RepID=UPI00399F2E65